MLRCRSVRFSSAPVISRGHGRAVQEQTRYVFDVVIRAAREIACGTKDTAHVRMREIVRAAITHEAVGVIPAG
jgi:hypothetical protein